MWWWLSFVDEDRPKGKKNLGVCIVSADGVVSAAHEAWKLEINPGGQVAGVHVPRPPMALRNRLLTPEEARALRDDPHRFGWKVWP
jgi:hypothetical protein